MFAILDWTKDILTITFCVNRLCQCFKYLFGSLICKGTMLRHTSTVFLRTTQLSFEAAEIMMLKVLTIFYFNVTYFCVSLNFKLIKINQYHYYMFIQEFKPIIIKNNEHLMTKLITSIQCYDSNFPPLFFNSYQENLKLCTVLRKK